jgi:hypothetical protein
VSKDDPEVEARRDRAGWGAEVGVAGRRPVVAWPEKPRPRAVAGGRGTIAWIAEMVRRGVEKRRYRAGHSAIMVAWNVSPGILLLSEVVMALA